MTDHALAALVEGLAARGVQLLAVGDAVWTDPPDGLTPAEEATLLRHGAALWQYLRATGRVRDPYLPCGCVCPYGGHPHLAWCADGHWYCEFCGGPAWLDRQAYQRDLAQLRARHQHDTAIDDDCPF